MFANLVGTAMRRGDEWADERRRNGARPATVADLELALKLAEAKRVEDMTRDPRLRARLARVVVARLSPDLEAALATTM